MTKVVELKKGEINQAAEVLAEAFEKDPLMLWIFGSEVAYKKYSQQVFEPWVRFCFLYGKAYRTENFATVGILRTPRHAEIGLWGLISSGMILNIWYLGWKGWKRLLTYDELSRIEKKDRIEREDIKAHWYLWMMGTKNDFQGKGLGGQVLKHIENSARLSGFKHIYLEASTHRSAEFYKRNDYQPILNKSANCRFFLPSEALIECLIKTTDEINGARF